jgi:hypothetical protein
MGLELGYHLRVAEGLPLSCKALAKIIRSDVARIGSVKILKDFETYFLVQIVQAN